MSFQPVQPTIESLESRQFLSAAPSAHSSVEPVLPAAALTQPLRTTRAKAIVINSASVALATKYSQARMDLIYTKLNFYFTHASVGGNILSGLSSLHSANPRRYRLGIVSSGDTPSGSTRKGLIYEYDRGNPSWQEKVDQLKTDLANGWGNSASVIINKFCFIDPNVSLQYYAVSNSHGSA